MIEAGIIFVAAVTGAVEVDREAAGFVAIGHTRLDASVIVGAAFECEQSLATWHRTPAKDVDHPMQCIRSMQSGAGTTQHLNTPGLFGVQVEQFVDVTKAGGPHRHTVLGDIKSPATAGAGQYRRADGREVLLAVAATDPDTGHPGQGVADMNMGNLLQLLTGNHRQTGGKA